MAIANRQFGYQVETLTIAGISFLLRFKTIDISMTAQTMESVAALDRLTWGGYTANRVKSRQFTIDINGVVEAIDTLTSGSVGFLPFAIVDDMTDKAVVLHCPFGNISGPAIVTSGEESHPGEASEGMIRLKFTEVPTFAPGS